MIHIELSTSGYGSSSSSSSCSAVYAVQKVLQNRAAARNKQLTVKHSHVLQDGVDVDCIWRALNSRWATRAPPAGVPVVQGSKKRSKPASVAPSDSDWSSQPRHELRHEPRREPRHEPRRELRRQPRRHPHHCVLLTAATAATERTAMVATAPCTPDSVAQSAALSSRSAHG